MTNIIFIITYLLDLEGATTAGADTGSTASGGDLARLRTLTRVELINSTESSRLNYVIVILYCFENFFFGQTKSLIYNSHSCGDELYKGKKRVGTLEVGTIQGDSKTVSPNLINKYNLRKHLEFIGEFTTGMEQEHKK